ncbi:MAG: VIT1/CCC1 transporter family protein [Candidatus Magasanikbacteria bacterium]|nr:VIT1/CCC1 transporter family protein [Candidatus Magasanikbacteria bacterium]
MSVADYHRRPDFIHHQKTPRASLIREVVFGMEDGMVSTMGAVTGIAVGTASHFVVVLSGFVIIAVESISMAVGSYLSSKSEKEIDERKLNEERYELKTYPREEKAELVEMYVKDGWPEPLATQMAEVASQNKNLFLQEMAYRELKIIPDGGDHPLQNGLYMGVAYIIGGAIPLLPYLLIGSPLQAIPVSVITTLTGLFMLGAYTTKFSKRAWWRAGLEMLLLAATAGFIGYIVGAAVDKFWLKQ